jgi:predicted metal-dependent TIM-barrel fold hydrolase
MALTERSFDDKIEIVGEFKNIQVRTTTVIERDGVEISRSFHRRTITTESDLTNESAEIQAIAATVHTQQVKEAYQAFRQAELDALALNNAEAAAEAATTAESTPTEGA